jgi:hypothetical protein
LSGFIRIGCVNDAIAAVNDVLHIQRQLEVFQNGVQSLSVAWFIVNVPDNERDSAAFARYFFDRSHGIPFVWIALPSIDLNHDAARRRDFRRSLPKSLR